MGHALDLGEGFREREKKPRSLKGCEALVFLVGGAGFEPATPAV